MSTTAASDSKNPSSSRRTANGTARSEEGQRRVERRDRVADRLGRHDAQRHGSQRDGERDRRRRHPPRRCHAAGHAQREGAELPGHRSHATDEHACSRPALVRDHRVIEDLDVGLRDRGDGAITGVVPVHPTPDAVEIKVNVSAAHADAALRDLRLKGSAAKRRDIWFYEHVRGIEGSAALPLFNRSVIARVRRDRARDEGDVTIKLRGAELSLPEEWSHRAEGSGWTFKIEGDWTGDRQQMAASLTAEFDRDRPATRRAPRLSKLVTTRQRDLLHRALAVPIDVATLRPLGPISARTWGAADLGFAVGVAAERWRAGSLQFLELSARVDAGDAEAAQRDFDAFLRGRGIEVAALEETKTELVLRHFAG